MLEKTVPIKTGSGEKSSTNYHPVFAIAGWVPRGDLAPQPKANGGGQLPLSTPGTSRHWRAAQGGATSAAFPRRRFRLILKN
jgi:hypothetical protein